MHWSDIREKQKSRDRYYEVYDNPESFWTTLDSKLVAWSYYLPSILGSLARVALALLGSNRYEPMPIGNREHVNTLWAGKPGWYRWLRWHIRNPWEDLKRFYLGFGQAEDVRWHGITEHFGFWLALFHFLPFRIPFPYYKNKVWGWELMLGWKSRGVLSLTVRR
ncbi:MAG: hypothetical protein ACOC43_03235 [Desulfohalobiaceae bacterium]